MTTLKFTILLTPLPSPSPRRSSRGSATPATCQTNLVANLPDYHPKIVDPKMIDAWGIALRPPGAGGHIWISNAATGTSSEYIGDVPGNPLHQDGLKIVELVQPKFTDHGYAFVTGQAYNSASDIPGQPVEFPVSGEADNRKVIAAGAHQGRLLRLREIRLRDGGRLHQCVERQHGGRDEQGPGHRRLFQDGRPPARTRLNCVFTGAALTNNAFNSEAFAKSGGNHLFAADIRNNVIRVFDNQWKDVTDSYHFQTPATVGPPASVQHSRPGRPPLRVLCGI